MVEGERQVAPTIKGIRRDHVARYEWAAGKLPKGCKVVDFACGVGYGTQILAKAGHHATGFDQDQEALAYAKNHYAHKRAGFFKDDANRPGRIGTVGAAVCFETIEHVKDPLPLLKQLNKRAPVLLASVPNEDVMPWQRADGKRIAFHFRHYTQAQFEALLNAAGWQVTEWWGQTGPKSGVVKNCKGRTLIAVAMRGQKMKSKVKKKPVQTSAPAHVVILGMGPSLSEYLNIVKRLGGRSAFCDEVWGINALGDVFDCDRVFHMDDVRIQEIRAAANPGGNIAAMLKWMKTHTGPIYTSRKHAGYPGLVEFPLEEVINHLGFAYFNSTAAYAVAYAVHIGVQKVTIFGNDFTYENAHHAEKGRACVEFWLGKAAERGIKLSIPRVSSLMDSCAPQGDRIYGYDTLDLQLKMKRGRMRVTSTEKKSLPTAAEIEHRYDHNRHPSPLVEKAAETR